MIRNCVRCNRPCTVDPFSIGDAKHAKCPPKVAPGATCGASEPASSLTPWKRRER